MTAKMMDNKTLLNLEEMIEAYQTVRTSCNLHSLVTFVFSFCGIGIWNIIFVNCPFQINVRHLQTTVDISCARK